MRIEIEVKRVHEGFDFYVEGVKLTQDAVLTIPASFGVSYTISLDTFQLRNMLTDACIRMTVVLADLVDSDCRISGSISSSEFLYISDKVKFKDTEDPCVKVASLAGLIIKKIDPSLSDEDEANDESDHADYYEEAKEEL